jgi:light-regulated signal transduction histidine kinase (bacteriophytochrome)
VRQEADFSGRYGAALETYFETGDELALSAAYDMGRQALGEGLGILDVVSTHEHLLLERVLMAPSPVRARWAQRAGDFLRESLSPFEMSFRGYREANQDLQRVNEQLARQRDAVEAVNRELEAFSYSVSHDLRAPLRSIDGFSQALLEDCAEALDDSGKRYLRHVREAAQEMGLLIDDLLKLARVARAEIARTDVDLGALARRIGDRLRLGDSERRVELVVAEGIHAIGDAGLLGVLLENLLGNAWKFTSKRDGARIEFGSYEREGHAVYFVRDNGAGFDMAHASKLFGTFQRLHAASEFPGTGIGLATVRRIVARHGGHVWAEGQVGQGATFSFTLDPRRGGP